MNSREIMSAILEVQMRLEPLQAQLTVLQNQHRHACSVEFIAEHGIVKSEIQSPNEPGMPWFGDVIQFAQWLKVHCCKKPWASWNDRIYRTSDLMAGRLPDAPGLVNDVPDQRTAA